MKYNEIDDWDIEGEEVHLKWKGRHVDTLDIHELVKLWLEKQADKECSEEPLDEEEEQ
jgi:hypothetical protein